jgi:hypothetical protein
LYHRCKKHPSQAVSIKQNGVSFSHHHKDEIKLEACLKPPACNNIPLKYLRLQVSFTELKAPKFESKNICITFRQSNEEEALTDE